VWKRNKQQIPTSSPGADNPAPSIQNINAPVFNVSIVPPEQHPLQRPASPPKAVVAQETLPNVRYIGAETVSMWRDMYGGLVEGDAKQNAMVIRFANEARVGAKNLSARLKPTLIYRYGQNEIDIAGSWLYEKGGAIDFEPDSRRHKLMVGMIKDEEFVTIASEKVVAHGRTWDMSDWLPLKGFQTGTVFVQLIDVHNSRVLFQGEFALNTNPLSITALFRSEAA
jgi:hypothetical protein